MLRNRTFNKDLYWGSSFNKNARVIGDQSLLWKIFCKSIADRHCSWSSQSSPGVLETRCSHNNGNTSHVMITKLKIAEQCINRNYYFKTAWSEMNLKQNLSKFLQIFLCYLLGVITLKSQVLDKFNCGILDFTEELGDWHQRTSIRTTIGRFQLIRLPKFSLHLHIWLHALWYGRALTLSAPRGVEEGSTVF